MFSACEKLSRMNKDVTVVPIYACLDRDNFLDLLSEYDAIVDGTDNFNVRFLLNEASIKFRIFWGSLLWL